MKHDVVNPLGLSGRIAYRLRWRRRRSPDAASRRAPVGLQRAAVRRRDRRRPRGAEEPRTLANAAARCSCAARTLERYLARRRTAVRSRRRASGAGRRVSPPSSSPRDQVEFLVGLGVSLYLDGCARPGVSARRRRFFALALDRVDQPMGGPRADLRVVGERARSAGAVRSGGGPRRRLPADPGARRSGARRASAVGVSCVLDRRGARGAGDLNARGARRSPAGSRASIWVPRRSAPRRIWIASSRRSSCPSAPQQAADADPQARTRVLEGSGKS